MGLFSKYKEYRESSALKKAEKFKKVIKNSKAIKEQRWEAIHFFKDLKDPEIAVSAFLTRFEFSLEHGINDTREKEACLDGIEAFGEEALAPLKSHLLTTTRIAWPIKALKAIGHEDQVVECLKSALNFDDIAFDQAKVDKNYDILCYLVDYQLGDFNEKVKHFLKDPDERVRYACAELLIEQDHPGIAEALEPFLADRSSESTRIRQTVIDGFIRREWSVTDATKFESGIVAEGVKLSKSGQLIRV